MIDMVVVLFVYFWYFDRGKGRNDVVVEDESGTDVEKNVNAVSEAQTKLLVGRCSHATLVVQRMERAMGPGVQ